MWEDIVGIKIFWMNNKFSFLYVIPTKNLLGFFLFKRMQFLKFNSSINLSFFGYTRKERSTYIKDFKFSWNTKLSHSRAAIFTLLFVYSKRISYLIFVGSGGASCCFNEDVHHFTSLFIISTRLIFLYLRISISSYSLLLPLFSSFIISTWHFLLHSRIPISSTSILLLFNSSFIISTSLFLLHLHLPISSSSLLIASLHCGILALKY